MFDNVCFILSTSDIINSSVVSRDRKKDTGKDPSKPTQLIR